MNATKNAVELRLAYIEWMTKDAARKLADYSKQIMRRAEEASEMVTAMESNAPVGCSWIDFLGDDLLKVKDARAELQNLHRQGQLLRMILRAE